MKDNVKNILKAAAVVGAVSGIVAAGTIIAKKVNDGTLAESIENIKYAVKSAITGEDDDIIEDIEDFYEDIEVMIEDEDDEDFDVEEIMILDLDEEDDEEWTEVE